MPKAPWGHSAVQGHSGPVPRAHGFDNWTRAICAGVQWLEGVDQHCGVTWDRSRTPTGLTNCPERLWPGSNAPRVCPGLPGDWGPCPRPRGVSSCAGRLRTGSEDLRSQTALSGHSQLCPRAGGVDQLSWVTGARDRRPSGSTSCPWRPALVSKCPRGDPMSLANRVWVQVPTGSTSSPGPLWPVPKDPRCRPADPGNWGPGAKALGVDQQSQATRACVLGHAGLTSCPGLLGHVTEGP